MASSKKTTATVTAKAAPAAVPAAAKTAKPAAAPKAVAKPAAKPEAAAPAAKPAPKRRVAAAKPLDPAVQASKEVLAKALAAAQAAKPVKPAKVEKVEKADKPEKAEKVEKVEKPVKAEKAPKVKKAKLVRDSFTMPEGEYEQIATLKNRLLDKGVVSKKSELLRAGVAMLAALSDADLVAAVGKIEVIKTGRPAKTGK